jgi:anthranilate phosphoribosyltransferase
VLEKLSNELAAARHLSKEQIGLAVEQLLSETVLPATKADFLCKLALKGETVEEISAFAHALREKSVAPPIDASTRAREILDVCGTGGDRLNTFNISTTVAIICAAAGIAVAKHGNRAITSQAGSADVLEALGIQVDLPPTEAARSLRERNFAFFFAPNYHPTFKHIAAARKLCAERGQRTIFNFLGPLLNPARPSAQLVGVSKPELCEPLAHVLQSLGVRRGMVVSGQIDPLSVFPSNVELTNRLDQIRIIGIDGVDMGFMSVSDALTLAGLKNAALIKITKEANPPIARLVDASELNPPQKRRWLDELSTLGDNTIAEFYQERGFTTSILETNHFPLQPASLADLAGGNREVNAEIIRQILRGKDRGPKRDAVLLNAAAALFVANRVRSLGEGWELAVGLIDGGEAQKKLSELAS